MIIFGIKAINITDIIIEFQKIIASATYFSITMLTIHSLYHIPWVPVIKTVPSTVQIFADLLVASGAH